MIVYCQEYKSVKCLDVYIKYKSNHYGTSFRIKKYTGNTGYLTQTIDLEFYDILSLNKLLEKKQRLIKKKKEI